MGTSLTIQSLRRQIRDREQGRHGHGERCCPWVVPLRVGAVHEWLADRGSPVAVLAGLVGGVIRSGVVGRVVWVGRSVFPYPVFLDSRVRAASLFVDASSADARVWAADLGARVPACVVVDGRGLGLACTRRLQLAAQAGGGVVLLARPREDERTLSAATTRWLIEPAAQVGSIAWSATLLRNKDEPTLAIDRACWRVEVGGDGLVVASSVVAGGADPAATRAAAS